MPVFQPYQGTDSEKIAIAAIVRAIVVKFRESSHVSIQYHNILKYPASCVQYLHWIDHLQVIERGCR